jgi:hypothetical protein
MGFTEGAGAGEAEAGGSKVSAVAGEGNEEGVAMADSAIVGCPEFSRFEEPRGFGIFGHQ